MSYKQNSIHYNVSTYTPEIEGRTSNPTVTYTTQNGIVTEIGDLVFLNVEIVINTISGGSGQAEITYPINGFANIPSSAQTIGVNWPTSTSYICATVPGVQVGIEIGATRDNNGTQFVQCSDLANGDTIRFNAVYFRDT